MFSNNKELVQHSTARVYLDSSAPVVKAE